MTKRFIKFKRLELNDCTITVQIEDVVWGKYKNYKGNKIDIQRGNYNYLCIAENFGIQSIDSTELDSVTLYILGKRENEDNTISAYTYRTEERAEEVFNLLKSIAIEEHKVITDVESLKERLDSIPMPAIIEESNKHWQSFTNAWNELYHKAEKIKTVSALNKLTNKIKEI